MSATKIPAQLVRGIDNLLTSAIAGQFAGLVQARDFTLCSRAPKAFDISALHRKTGVGSATVTVKIDGVAVTGLSAIAAGTVGANTAASGAYAVPAGGRVTMTIAAPSADCADLEWTLAIAEPTS